jgi:hypothetical protein
MPPPKSGEFKPVLVEDIAEHEAEGWVVVGRKENPCGVNHIPVSHKLGGWPTVLMERKVEP